MQIKTVFAIASLAAVAGVLFAGRSEAGTKSPEPVVIDVAHKAFWGNMGSARASADSLQYIGCEISSSAAALSANCTARDAAGTSVTCSTTNANMIQAAGAVGSGSTVVVVHDGAGTCTSVRVQNYSYFSIKVP